MTPPQGHSIGTRTARGMLWAYGSYVGGRLLVLASTVVLARVLAPDDFGLVALALVFMTLLDSVSDLGVTQALVIVEEDVVLARAETAFVFSLAFGALLTLATASLGPPAAAFFDESELVALLPVLGTNFLLRSLGTTHYALAQKRLDFRSRTAAELADAVVRGSAGIGLALAGLGAWSLVLGYLAGTAALTAVLWALVPWRPSFHPQRAHLRGLLGFGGTMSAVRVLWSAVSNVDYLMIGRYLGTTSLGLYTLGFRLPELLILNLSVVAADVLFPAFAAVERRALGSALVSSLRYTAMVGLPLAAGLAVLAEPFTLVVFGDQWRDSVGPMQVLTLYALAAAVGIPARTVYKAVGRADILLKLAVPHLVLLVAALLLFVEEGTVAVAACQAGVAALFALVGMVFASRFLRLGVRPLAGAVWPALAAALAMAAVLLLVSALIETSWLTLTVGLPLGGGTYLAVLWMLAKDEVRKLWRTAFPRAAGPSEVPELRQPDVIA